MAAVAAGVASHTKQRQQQRQQQQQVNKRAQQRHTDNAKEFLLSFETCFEHLLGVACRLSNFCPTKVKLMTCRKQALSCCNALSVCEWESEWERMSARCGGLPDASAVRSLVSCTCSCSNSPCALVCKCSTVRPHPKHRIAINTCWAEVKCCWGEEGGGVTASPCCQLIAINAIQQEIMQKSAIWWTRSATVISEQMLIRDGSHVLVLF